MRDLLEIGGYIAMGLLAWMFVNLWIGGVLLYLGAITWGGFFTGLVTGFMGG